jgi:hypothetical protein
MYLGEVYIFPPSVRKFCCRYMNVGIKNKAAHSFISGNICLKLSVQCTGKSSSDNIRIVIDKSAQSSGVSTLFSPCRLTGHESGGTHPQFAHTCTCSYVQKFRLVQSQKENTEVTAFSLIVTSSTVCLSFCLSVCLSVCFFCLSVFLSVCFSFSPQHLE